MASTANRSSAHVVVYAALAGNLAIAALGVAGGAGLGLGRRRGLLTGEAASPRIVAEVRKVLEAGPRIDSVAEVLSMHLGPQEILLGVTLDFQDHLTAADIEAASDHFADLIQGVDKRITRVFVRSGRAREAYARRAGG